MPTPHTCRVDARLAEASTLADFTETAVRPLDGDLSLKARLVVEELFVNTVTHGHGGDTDATVELTVTVATDGVDLTYVDTAPPFDPFAAVNRPDGAAAVEGRAVGRLGVHIITLLADRYAYARTGERNRITMHLPLRPVRPA